MHFLMYRKNALARCKPFPSCASVCRLLGHEETQRVSPRSQMVPDYRERFAGGRNEGPIGFLFWGDQWNQSEMRTHNWSESEFFFSNVTSILSTKWHVTTFKRVSITWYLCLGLDAPWQCNKFVKFQTNIRNSKCQVSLVEYSRDLWPMNVSISLITSWKYPLRTDL